MISAPLRAIIKGYLEGFIQAMVNEHRGTTLAPTDVRPHRAHSADGDIKPFHEALLPDGILRITEFERSFSTRLGTTFEEVARLIGASHHADAQRGFRIIGDVSADAIRTIERIVNSMGSGGMTSTYPELVAEVLAIPVGGGSERRRIADLYIKKRDDTELFFEIKSPKPNKGQCLEATDRLLQIHAIRRQGPPRLQTYYAMAYNPYGDDKRNYRHSFTTNYMDVDNEVLIGKEFWDMVGEDGTYEEVLDIYREVGREKGPDMLDQLALRY